MPVPPSPRQSSPVPIYFQTMSPVPAEPTSSALPPAAQEARENNENSQSEASSHNATPAPDDLPKPLLRLELRDLRHESTKTFLTNVDPVTDIEHLVNTVVRLLYYPSHTHQSNASSTPTPTSPATTTRPSPHKPSIPGTRSITLIPHSIDGVAYTTGLDLDSSHKEIHFSLSYISHVARTSSTPAAVRKELLGVICHELVHCYQYDGNGTAPGGLIEGIADWVRLRAGFVPPHWKREAGEGKSWDGGYQTTGYFLDWIEGVMGEGSVRRINDTLRRGEYEEDKFWKVLFGKEVGTLWKEYAKTVEKE